MLFFVPHLKEKRTTLAGGFKYKKQPVKVALSTCWWSMGDSNPRPRQCECRALSAELMPRPINYTRSLKNLQILLLLTRKLGNDIIELYQVYLAR